MIHELLDKLPELKMLRKMLMTASLRHGVAGKKGMMKEENPEMLMEDEEYSDSNDSELMNEERKMDQMEALDSLAESGTVAKKSLPMDKRGAKVKVVEVENTEDPMMDEDEVSMSDKKVIPKLKRMSAEVSDDDMDEEAPVYEKFEGFGPRRPKNRRDY